MAPNQPEGVPHVACLQGKVSKPRCPLFESEAGGETHPCRSADVCKVMNKYMDKNIENQKIVCFGVFYDVACCHCHEAQAQCVFDISG